ncbi:MAG: hypothetical protein OHK0057_06560 [Thermoflexibacter sp.]
MFEKIKKAIDKHRFSIMILLATACLGLSISTLILYTSYSALHQDWVQLKDEQEKSRVDLAYLSKKSEVDEYFIEGNFEQALQKYQALSKEYPKSKMLVEKRQEAHQTTQEKVESHHALLAYFKKELANYQSFIRVNQQKIREMAVSQKIQEEANQHFIDSLQLALHQMNNELKIADSLSNIPIPQKEVLRFKNYKGKQVIYLGEVANGKANEQGIGILETGAIYEGSWKNNFREGKGIYQWADGEKYEGVFVKDERNGFGIYFWKNGERYEGYWRNDKRHGKGKVLDKNGKEKLNGEWKDDQIIKMKLLIQNFILFIFHIFT